MSLGCRSSPSTSINGGTTSLGVAWRSGCGEQAARSPIEASSSNRLPSLLSWVVAGMCRWGTRPLWDASQHGRIAVEGKDAGTSLVQQRAWGVLRWAMSLRPSSRSRCVGLCMATLRVMW